MDEAEVDMRNHLWFHQGTDEMTHDMEWSICGWVQTWEPEDFGGYEWAEASPKEKTNAISVIDFYPLFMIPRDL